LKFWCCPSVLRDSTTARAKWPWISPSHACTKSRQNAWFFAKFPNDLLSIGRSESL
jgi:hypothetical protein